AIRQSYFRDREIKFSRLTPIDLEGGQTLGAMIAEETTRTWQYLDSLRHFTPEDRLEVCVLIHSRDREAIQPHLKDFAQIQYRILDIEQVALKLGLKAPPLGSSAEEVLAHLFLIHPEKNHFASSEMRRYATLRTVRIVVNQVSLGVFAAGLAWGGWNFARMFQSGEADQRVGQELNAVNREYDSISRATPTFGVAGAVMRDAVAFYNGSIRGFPTVVDFLGPLSTILQVHPQIQLAQIAWNATDDPKTAPKLSATAQHLTPPVKALSKFSDSAAAPSADESTNPPFAGGRYEVAMLEGTVSVPNNDFRAALAEIERLVADIGRLPGFSAEVVESPLDVSSARSLQGQYGERDSAAAMEPRFVLRIVRERKGAA
ncbi:MAG TPA: hypothetical protein VN878_08725, partial [Usitatibacter sp.]|nr:hypothetical protein [Usitatibacter sp.]